MPATGPRKVNPIRKRVRLNWYSRNDDFTCDNVFKSAFLDLKYTAF